MTVFFYQKIHHVSGSGELAKFLKSEQKREPLRRGKREREREKMILPLDSICLFTPVSEWLVMNEFFWGHGGSDVANWLILLLLLLLEKG